MKRGGMVVAMVAALVAASLSAAAGPDKGRDQPPAKLTSDYQAIWMTEWTACWRPSLHSISKQLHIPVGAGTTPQQAANRLAHRAVQLLYNTEEEYAAAIDGCRNGVLWRYYHPSSS